MKIQNPHIHVSYNYPALDYWLLGIIWRNFHKKETFGRETFVRSSFFPLNGKEESFHKTIAYYGLNSITEPHKAQILPTDNIFDRIGNAKY